MSKNKDFNGSAHKPGGSVGSSTGGDTLDKVCELVDQVAITNENLEALCDKTELVLECFEELKKISANPVGIESSFAEVGCVFEEGEITGKVFACKIVSEETEEVSFKYWLFQPGQAPIEDYAGAWEFCSDECIPAPFAGLVTSWS